MQLGPHRDALPARRSGSRFGALAALAAVLLVAAACDPASDVAVSSTRTASTAASTTTAAAATPTTAVTVSPSSTAPAPPAAWPEVPDWAQPAVAYLEAYRTALNSGDVEQVFPFLGEDVAWWDGEAGGHFRIGMRDTLTGLIDRAAPRRLPGTFVATWFPAGDGVGYRIDWIHEVLPEGCTTGEPCARIEDVHLVVVDGAVVSHVVAPLAQAGRVVDRYADIARRLSSGDADEAAGMISDRPVWVDLGDGEFDQYVPRELFAEQLAGIFAEVPDAEVLRLTTADLGLPGPPRPAVFSIPTEVLQGWGFGTIGGLGVYRQRLDAEVDFLIAFEWLERDDGIVSFTAELEPEALAGWAEDAGTAPMVEDPALWPAIPRQIRRLTGTIQAGGGTVSIYNGSESRRALVEWALERYAEAGLPEPVPRTISFPPSVECVIYEGLATDTGDGVDLDLCFGEEETCTGDDCHPSTAAKSTLLHELGHVWTVQYADAEARDAFLAARGLEVWSGEGVDRDHLGTEHAAEILAWALLDEPTWAARLPDNDCEDLAAGFRALTGVEPPRVCESG